MDETTKAIIEKITVRYSVPQKISSGDLCSVFYDCIRLSPADLARLAAEATGDLPEGEFDMVVGIAYTGILFASAVAGGKLVTILTNESNALAGPSVKGKRVLVVDDVAHEGKRLLSARDIVEKAGGDVVGFACIIDRSEGKFPSKLPLWSAHQTVMA